jgi:predicted ATPase
MNPPNVFISYAREDAPRATRLDKHLHPLVIEGMISVWFDEKIKPGEEWRPVIENAMRDTDVALFVVTVDFIASEFCQNVEVPYLLQKRDSGEMLAVSIIADHCNWQAVKWIAQTNVLPPGGRAVTARRQHSQAWTEVSHELRKLIEGTFQTKKGSPSRVATRSTPATSSTHSLELLLAELPGAANELFGREEDLTFLDDALRDPDIAIVTLVGFGGVGKSALVRHWLTHNVRSGNFRFIGCSFYSQGTHEQAGSSDQFLVEALRNLGDPEPDRGLLSMRARRLAKMIGDKPTILVLDGLEPLQFGLGVKDREGHLKDEGIRELLAGLTGLIHKPGRSLCVVTTRVPLMDPVLQSPHLVERSLDVLPPAAAVQLLRSRGIKGSSEALKEAAAHLGHHALALVLAAEYLDTFKKGRVTEVEHIPLIGTQTSRARHANSVMAAYVHALERDGNLLDLEILHLLGLFDRPAAWEWLGALRSEPVIEGVTAQLTKASDREVWESLSRLRQWELVLNPQSPSDTNIDAHPLVREYFGERLRELNPRGWRKAHERLYEHFRENAEPLPDTLAGMAPLMLAVAHGCKAGRYRDALHEVYLPRIMRREQLYAAQQLGAMASLLSVLMQFFVPGDWRHPVTSPEAPEQGLGIVDQIIVLSHAGMCLTALRGYAAPEVEQCYAAARDLCLDLGETRELFIALYGLWRFYLVRGEAKQTQNVAKWLYTLSQRLPGVEAAAERVMCTTYFYEGDMALAAEHGRKGVSLPRPPETMKREAVLFLNEPGISCLWYWGMSLWFLGDADAARKLIDDSVSRSRELGHAHTLALSLMYDAMLSQLCSDAPATLTTAAELMTLCADEGFSLWRIAGEVLHGWARTQLGEKDAGTEQLKAAMLAWAGKGAKLFRVYCLAMLADIHRESGRIAQGLEALEEGRQLAAYGEGWWEAEVYRLKGELLLLADQPDEAGSEKAFLEARAIARRQHAIALELRAAMSRGALLHSKGKGAEAAEIVESLYARFNSGFDTADMKEAKSLVREWK